MFLYSTLAFNSCEDSFVVVSIPFLTFCSAYVIKLSSTSCSPTVVAFLSIFISSRLYNTDEQTWTIMCSASPTALSRAFFSIGKNVDSDSPSVIKTITCNASLKRYESSPTALSSCVWALSLGYYSSSFWLL